MNGAVKHWKIQRYSAIMNLFIALWLAFSLLCIQGNSYEETIKWLKYPINSILISLFFITSFLHMRLGLQVVIEDYVSKILLRKRLIIGINSLSWILTIISIVSVLKIVIFN
ncbi:MAG: succinate dehydrogenase, hydrophobic membrane anchor protein [Alphaproteobacteria bacterium]|nr:succinate dehydrogenase, hydrophobic membrane anchor protein [Alphaproteobacteria bacterium]